MILGGKRKGELIISLSYNYRLNNIHQNFYKQRITADCLISVLAPEEVVHKLALLILVVLEGHDPGNLGLLELVTSKTETS